MEKSLKMKKLQYLNQQRSKQTSFMNSNSKDALLTKREKLWKKSGEKDFQ